MDRGENSNTVLTSGLILVTFLMVNSLFFLRRATSDERLRSGSRQRKGCDGFRETFHQLRRRVAVLGHHLSLATHLHHQPGTEIFLSVSATNNQSRFSFLPSSFAFFTLFLLRFNAIFTLSAKSTFDLAALQLPFGHGFGLLRTVVPLPVVHGITIQAKLVSMADASKLVSIFFASVLRS